MSKHWLDEILAGTIHIDPETNEWISPSKEWIDKTGAKILAKIAKLELKARIDELERLPESTRWISRAGKNINVLDRLKELRKELLDE